MAKNWAIVIGINEYEHLPRPLRFAKRDAELMRNFLADAKFERIYYFSDDSPNINGSSTRPTRSNLERLLELKFENPFMEIGDNFWFFFSGHGVRCNGRDYLIPRDAYPENISKSAIAVDYVIQRLRRCGADNVVLILDACREQDTRSVEGIGQQTVKQVRQTGIVSIFSCGPNEYSYEIEALQQGVFTYALLEGLGVQGQCATVERLNHYITRRVPELNSQYGRPPQTPYTIAEPLSKSHLILLPQYATLADIATIKADAWEAEVESDFALAKQLWMRVLAMVPADINAVKALQRIAVKEMVSAVLHPCTYRPEIEEVDEGELCNESVDYADLQNLLATGQWREADLETFRIMLLVTGRTNQGGLNDFSLTKFPCEQLRVLDQLWVNYSKGRFGFSVQKRIWESVSENKVTFIDNTMFRFCKRIEWRCGNKWLRNYWSLTFESTAAEGHLPGRYMWGEEGGLDELPLMFVIYPYFLQRLETCGILSQPQSMFSNNSQLDSIFSAPSSVVATSANSEIEVRSERGANYTNLHNFLATEQWENADKETMNHLGKVFGKEAVKVFPCEDLQTIDRLWLKYSNGNFGFSVQRKILDEVFSDSDVTPETCHSDYKIAGNLKESQDRLTNRWNSFGDALGWRVQNNWIMKIDYSEKNVNSLRSGYLPCLGVPPTFLCVMSGNQGFIPWWWLLLSRIKACEL